MREYHYKCYACGVDLGISSIPYVKCPECGKEQVGIVN